MYLSHEDLEQLEEPKGLEELEWDDMTKTPSIVSAVVDEDGNVVTCPRCGSQEYRINRCPA